MPVDLDELFATLGHQADAIPVAPPETVIRRGRQRRRNQGVAAAAVAVCLVVAGVSGVLNRSNRPDQTVTPHPSATALPEVGSPIDFGGPAQNAESVVEGDRVFTAWQSADGSRVGLLAADLHTGAVAWRVPGPDRIGVVHQLVAVPGAVLLGVADSEQPSEYRIYVHRSTDGRLLWQSDVDGDDELLPHEKILLRQSRVDGRTDALDWRTGAKRWALPAAADPIMLTFAERDRTELNPLAYLRSEHLMHLTLSGQVQVRDAETAALVRTVGPIPFNDMSSLTVVDGRLYNAEVPDDGSTGYRIHVTDLRTDGGKPAEVYRQAEGRSFGHMDVCGPDRICVIDQDTENGSTKSTIRAIDLATKRRLWQVDGPPNGDTVLKAGDYLTAVGDTAVYYDSNGRELFTQPPGQTAMHDPATLLSVPITLAGTVSTIRIADGAVTALGTVPQRLDICAATPERLACATGTDLRIWSLTG
jgi:hypothetical protein